jgi:hypothetical protein
MTKGLQSRILGALAKPARRGVRRRWQEVGRALSGDIPYLVLSDQTRCANSPWFLTRDRNLDCLPLKEVLDG